MVGDENKSRPLYPGLAPDLHALQHLITAEGEGASAVIDLLSVAPMEMASRSTLLYTPSGSSNPDHAAPLSALGIDDFHIFPTIPTLLVRLNGLLGKATMGTRLYVTGTEGFIGQVAQLALSHGIDSRALVSEHRGSLARRVLCIHCKGITQNVTTNIVPCSHCGIPLQVRDHYSRRLGAFMGVSGDAETPGSLPVPEETFR